jgi:hypothetical protein
MLRLLLSTRDCSVQQMHFLIDVLRNIKTQEDEKKALS